MTAELQINNLVHHVQSVCLSWLGYTADDRLANQVNTCTFWEFQFAAHMRALQTVCVLSEQFLSHDHTSTFFDLIFIT